MHYWGYLQITIFNVQKNFTTTVIGREVESYKWCKVCPRFIYPYPGLSYLQFCTYHFVHMSSTVHIPYSPVPSSEVKLSRGWLQNQRFVYSLSPKACSCHCYGSPGNGRSCMAHTREALVLKSPEPVPHLSGLRDWKTMETRSGPCSHSPQPDAQYSGTCHCSTPNHTDRDTNSESRLKRIWIQTEQKELHGKIIK